MSRKFLTMVLVLAAVSITSVVGFAGGGSTTLKQATNVEAQKSEKEIDLIVNSENGIQTEEDIVLITIKGKEGSNVTLEVYLNSNVSTREDLQIAETIKDEDYTLLLTEDIQIKDLGTYSKEIKLKKGLYKIVAIKSNGIISHIDTKYILCMGTDDVDKILSNAKKAPLIPITDVIKTMINSK
ncbi:hypothetical protein SAMN05660462_02342 [Proteiniborus ethanoligenes]|uniref:Uncharacterized protein n=1 Tax=Proteiniborus ethanoligenes TaxID=415015 RepID=A0A1H3RFT2_9FIRM|nr:hypothetical protein [Proteiniborus ethanoligenes]SDZ24185.1 hypothetical protein SAMN05660462_02342 [Proteiniborus ethanoligenes]